LDPLKLFSLAIIRRSTFGVKINLRVIQTTRREERREREKRERREKRGEREKRERENGESPLGVK